MWFVLEFFLVTFDYKRQSYCCYDIKKRLYPNHALNVSNKDVSIFKHISFFKVVPTRAIGNQKQR